MTVYDGADSNAPLLLASSGNTLPAPVTSTRGSMFVVFKSDESVTSFGFDASVIFYCIFRRHGLAGIVSVAGDGVPWGRPQCLRAGHEYAGYRVQSRRRLYPTTNNTAFACTTPAVRTLHRRRLTDAATSDTSDCATDPTDHGVANSLRRVVQCC